MKKLLPLFAFLALGVIAQAQSVITKFSGAPNRNTFIISYDDTFLFLARHYGDHRDFGGNTEPGLFVHSKRHGYWLQILKISTEEGIFGKSWSENNEDMKNLMMASVGWDFTSLANQEYVDIPLHTSGSLAFPDKIEWDKEKDRYRLRFMSSAGVPSAESSLYILRSDLENAFDKYKRP